jgi:uncharacterized membrane protein YuzA (DUF378 family)
LHTQPDCDDPAARVVYVVVGLAAIWTLIASTRMRSGTAYREKPAIR